MPDSSASGSRQWVSFRLSKLNPEAEQMKYWETTCPGIPLTGSWLGELI